MGVREEVSPDWTQQIMMLGPISGFDTFTCFFAALRQSNRCAPEPHCFTKTIFPITKKYE